jgi:hypothetical protein
MRPRGSILRSIGKWSAELLLVFLGAYAAFWLANHQEHLQEARRRQLILAALEEQFANDIDNVKAQRDQTAKGLAAFQKKLEAGEMPPLNSFSFTTDYSASDVAALLQSGGYQLLDVKTLFAVRQLESVLRRGVSTMQRAQQLSDSLIVPNLDQDITFFYDPATKQLRKRFTRYIEALQAFPQFYDEYIKALTELLTQIRAERAKQ